MTSCPRRAARLRVGSCGLHKQCGPNSWQMSSWSQKAADLGAQAFLWLHRSLPGPFWLFPRHCCSCQGSGQTARAHAGTACSGSAPVTPSVFKPHLHARLALPAVTASELLGASSLLSRAAPVDDHGLGGFRNSKGGFLHARSASGAGCPEASLPSVW